MNAEIKENKSETCRWLYLSALPLGILADYLFYGRSTGASYPAFVAVYMLIYYWRPPFAGLRQRTKTETWLLSYIFLLSLTFAIFSNSHLLFINFILTPFLIIAHNSITLQNTGYRWYDFRFVKTVMKKMGAVSFAWTSFFTRHGDIFARPLSAISGTTKSVLTGLAFSIPLLGLIIYLLASADMIFNNIIANIFEIDITKILFHAIYITMVSAIIFGYLLKQIESPATERDQAVSRMERWSMDQAFASTVLVAMNLVYLLFTVVQFSYLFGGEGNTLWHGMNYSEYARRGFFELLTVSVINLSIMAASMTFTRHDSKKFEIVLNCMYIFLAAFTLVIDYSAHFRLSLYENAYGYTYLRIYSHAMMLFLAILFISTLFKIINRKLVLTRMYSVMAMMFYLVINYVNVDSVIAEKNVERFQNTGLIDVYYLKGLSYDAIPYLYKIKDTANPQLREEIRSHLISETYLLKSLHQEGWQAFNLSKYSAMSILAQGNL